jgi:hypothetical protein
MPGADLLNGLRVLDFSRVLAGPFCTALLADLGAEVIKVEPPGGDDYRHIGPFKQGESALFLLMNRGKKSLTLNLKSARATALAQVVVENFKPGVAGRLGVDHETLRAINPRLVYASISGFGQSGPLADRPAYDIIAQAMAGLMSVTGEPEGPPTRTGESMADLCGGLYAAWAITAPRSSPASAAARAGASTSPCSTRSSRCCPRRSPSISTPARTRDGPATGTRSRHPSEASARPTARSSSRSPTTRFSPGWRRR